ncbi:GNAT family N-acetyltransferase [Salipaludibacillus sp. HK11]|uniref:GNAT family N-acetyltransferase n=1 Tax=Salipaludibacillus sp. HK11 TaxID=3394320 RepID=UPI0039FCF868
MNQENKIIELTKSQLLLDYNCKITDFDKSKIIITKNDLVKGSRKFNDNPCFLKILCFSGRAIVSGDEHLLPWVEENLSKEDPNWLFEYPKLRFIDKEMNQFGHELADIHHYYIPKANARIVKPLFDVNWFDQKEILQFKNDERFGEALGFKENHPDVIAVAAVDGSRIMGMAGASADSETLWQIGIDVLPEFRGKGVGTNLTALLKQAILEKDRIPFYGTVESHNISKSIAISAGFIPAWAETYTTPKRGHR